MLSEQVISQKVSITRKGAIQHFQLRIPRHAEKIIAIECGVKMISALPAPAAPAGFVESLQFVCSRMMGELRLQHVGKGGLFFSTQVIEQDAHLPFADFSMANGFTPKSWTHSGKREPLNVDIDREAPVILGIYRDIAGSQIGQNLQYDILIHIWFKTLEEEV